MQRITPIVFSEQNSQLTLQLINSRIFLIRDLSLRQIQLNSTVGFWLFSWFLIID